MPVLVRVACLVASALVAARPLPAAPEGGLDALAPVVGRPSSDLVHPGDTLLDLAWRHRLGFERVARLNPYVDVWIPDPGTVVRLPSEHVLPDAPRRGLVINVPEMQLYDFTRPEAPEVFAIAIGDEMDPSLLGEFRIGKKRTDPAWRVPASIRAERPELPAVVPPGPDNPLGSHWMTIGSTSYGIHGTNVRWSIGREATHGCIRLYNDEMARLFERTPRGTPIRLVYQTVKLGRRGQSVYVEAHPDVYGREPERQVRTRTRLAELGLLEHLDADLVRAVVAAARGEPVSVGTVPEDVPSAATSRPTS